MTKARKLHRPTKRISKPMAMERQQMVPHLLLLPQRRWMMPPKSLRRHSTAIHVVSTAQGFDSTTLSMIPQQQAQQLQRSNMIYAQIATSKLECLVPIDRRTLSSWKNPRTARYQIETHLGLTLRRFYSWKVSSSLTRTGLQFRTMWEQGLAKSAS